jgi:hypothetical protein
MGIHQNFIGGQDNEDSSGGRVSRVIGMALKTFSEPLISMNLMKGNPRKLMVSCL